MTWSWKRWIGGGIAFVAAVALVSTVASTPAQADHQPSWSGQILGGLIGGAIGSQIGKGRGKMAAIGAGALLGSLYGRHVAEAHHWPRAHYRPAHRHHGWYGHRTHHGAWYAPRKRHHHGYHHGHHHRWKHARAYDPVVVVPPAPVVVQPAPVVIERAPRPAPANYIVSGSSRAAPRQHGGALTECQVLEEGISPVYACRDASGGWQILR